MNETPAQIWKDFSEKHNGVFDLKSEQVYTASFNLSDGELHFETLKKPLSSSNKIRTRVVYKLNFQPTFSFKVRHQGIFNKLFTTFGMQDLVIDETYFDDNFIIQGNNEHHINELFKNETVTNFLPKSYELTFKLEDETLQYTGRGFVTETSMLECLLTLMKNSATQIKELS